MKKIINIKDKFKSKFKKMKLFDYYLPQYLVIGAEHHGKTTLIKNCGLTYFLGNHEIDHYINDANQNKYLYQWFTQEATFIEVKSDFENIPDEDFTFLMEKTKNYNLNGILLVIDITSLLRSSTNFSEKIEWQLQKILKLSALFGGQYLIYIVFTKCDLIAGFCEYFEKLDKNECENHLGFNLPLNQNPHELINYSTKQYDNLISQLNCNLSRLLDLETNLTKRILMYFFPQQLLLLKNLVFKLMQHLLDYFQTNRLIKISGIYFTSIPAADGATFDVLGSVISQQFQLLTATSTVSSSRYQTYFVKNLFRKVIIPQTKMITTPNYPTRVENKRLWKRRIINSLIILMLAIGAIQLNFTLIEYKRRLLLLEPWIQQTRLAVDHLYNKDLTLESAFPALDSFKRATQIYLSPIRQFFIFPFHKHASIRLGLEEAQQRILQELFLPALSFRLESLLSTHENRASVGISEDPDDQSVLLLKILKGYYFLGNPKKYPDEWLKNACLYDWNNLLKLEPYQKQVFNYYLALLLTHHFKPILLDEHLIHHSLNDLQKLTSAEWIYNRIKQQSKKRSELNLYQALGNKASQLFNPISVTIPALFTAEGVNDIYLSQLSAINQTAIDYLEFLSTSNNADKHNSDNKIASAPLLRSVQNEMQLPLYSVVTQAKAPLLRSVQTRKQLPMHSAGTQAKALLLRSVQTVKQFPQYSAGTVAVQRVNSLYINDYIEQWQHALDKLKISPIVDLNQAINTIKVWYSTNSPFINLLSIINKNTNITIGKDNNDTNIRSYFSAINYFNIEKNRIAVIKNLKDLVNELQKINQATNVNQAAFEEAKAIMSQRNIPNPTSALIRLRLQADQMPQPIRNWLYQISDNCWKILIEKSREYVANLWQSNIARKFALLAGYYPINDKAEYDSNLNDFNDFFANGGVYDNFFKNYLLPFIDVSVSPWQWIRLYNQSLFYSQILLTQFSNTSTAIKHFFPDNNDKTVNQNFSLKPFSLSDNVAQVRLKIGDQILLYRHDPQEETAFKWPPSGPNQITLTFVDFDGQMKTHVFGGPWALMKFIKSGVLQPTPAPDHYQFTFTNDKFVIQFQLVMSGVNMSSLSNAMKEIKLPKKLFN